jgi:hypothetical protein
VCCVDGRRNSGLCGRRSVAVRPRDPFQGCDNKNQQKDNSQLVAIVQKDVVHPPGVEPGPIAWKAIILPLDQECLMKKLGFSNIISHIKKHIAASRTRRYRSFPYTAILWRLR